MKYFMTGQEKGDLLIEVTTWTSLPVTFIIQCTVKSVLNQTQRLDGGVVEIVDFWAQAQHRWHEFTPQFPSGRDVQKISNMI